MKFDEFSQKVDDFVNARIASLKANGGLVKDAITCPSCNADLTEWRLRHDLAKFFREYLRDHGVYPEP